MLTFVPKGEIMNRFISVKLVKKCFEDAKQGIYIFCADVNGLKYLSLTNKQDLLD